MPGNMPVISRRASTVLITLPPLRQPRQTQLAHARERTQPFQPTKVRVAVMRTDAILKTTRRLQRFLGRSDAIINKLFAGAACRGASALEEVRP
jgi:hypothetical protein